MSYHNFKIIISLVLLIIFNNFGFSQNPDSFWKVAKANKNNFNKVQFTKSTPEKSSILFLEAARMFEFLEAVPKRGANKTSSKILSFPTANGSFESFRVEEASVMAAELQGKFPNIKSYVGRGVKNPSSVIRFSMSKEKGLSSMVLSEGETVFIEPYDLNENVYISYINSANDKDEDDFECLTEYNPIRSSMSDVEFKALKNADDGKLRTYRLALACTVEYAQFHGGTVEGVMAAMNATMTRVNGIFERDMGLTMELVANNDDIIFLGPGVDSDPYTNDSGSAMLNENQKVCDDTIGSANYDIGHVFSTGGGGVAFLNSPCTNFKAGGVTGSSSPEGDTFDIDFVIHEMGHQFGANHTQNNDCNRADVSVETGSGSTIMGYAGICTPNVQNNSDDYFHGESIKEMWLNISQGNSTCAGITTTGNTAPVVKVGANYFIPKSTPFVLRGEASDPDSGDVLTYAWEQIDRTPAPMPPQSTSTSGPLFRSIPPTTSPNRFMPAFSTVLSGSLSSTWEVVPSVARKMNFLLTVRDNSTLGGNTSSEEIMITTVDTDPFVAQTPPTWASGSTQTVNWIVGESNLAPINCETVNIYFSEDGVDFSTVLATSVPNSGSAEVTLPSVPNTSTARLLVEAVNNVFYSVSEPFSIGNSPDFIINAKNPKKSICNLDTASYEFEFITSNGFSETTELTVLGPNIVDYAFSRSNLNADGNFTLNLSNLLELSPGDYRIEVTGTSNSVTKTVSVDLNISTGACRSVANTEFQTSTTGVIINDGQTDILSNLDTGKPSGYSNFTNIVTDLTISSQYNLTVNANSDGDFEITTYVWIDWNQNCSYDDPGEQYDLGKSRNTFNQPTSNSPLTFTVPQDAILGNTRMRVTTKYTPGASDIPLACENNHDAEVEDYTINVKASLSQESFSLQNLVIYPNPSQGKFTIELTADASTAVQLSIYDLRGRSLVKQEYDVYGKFQKELDLSHLASGIYLLEISDGSRNLTKKIIKE